jgi:hypothetical protein
MEIFSHAINAAKSEIISTTTLFSPDKSAQHVFGGGGWKTICCVRQPFTHAFGGIAYNFEVSQRVETELSFSVSLSLPCANMSMYTLIVFM